MEDTCCNENCPFVKQGFCGNVKECPNYMESWWQTQEAGKTSQKLVKDCSPKRMMLIAMTLQNQMESVQIANEQSRNEYNTLSGYLKTVVESSKTVLEHSIQKQILLDRKKDVKQLDFDLFD